MRCDGLWPWGSSPVQQVLPPGHLTTYAAVILSSGDIEWDCHGVYSLKAMGYVRLDDSRIQTANK